MKSFKFLGALALLTGAMLVATSCNKKDNEPTSGQIPTLNEILGSWQFDDVPEGLDLLIPGLDITVEDVVIYLSERGQFVIGTPTSGVNATYSYSPADGKLSITMKEQTLEIPLVIVLTKGPGADQITATLPTGDSTTLTKICDGNFFAGDCQGDDPQPEDDEKTGTIPSAEEMPGTWHFDIVPEHFAFDFLDGVAAEDLHLWLANPKKEDNISTVGSMQVNNSNGIYDYEEETGKLSITWSFADREDFVLEGTVVYVRTDYICLTVELVEGELAQNIYLTKVCDGNMFYGDCSGEPEPGPGPEEDTYPASLYGSWDVISGIPAAIKGMLQGNDGIIYFGADNNGVSQIGYALNALVDGSYEYNPENGALSVTYNIAGVDVTMSDAVVTDLGEGQINIYGTILDEIVDLILEFNTEDN